MHPEIKDNEMRILHHILMNANMTFKEIAKETDMTESSVRRISNRLKQYGVYKEISLPNFALLGFKVMMLQVLKVASSKARDIPVLISRITSCWSNCVDCCETFDGKIVVRSVWRDPEDFRNSRAELHQVLGTEWLLQEDIEMIPLDESKEFIRLKSPFSERLMGKLSKDEDAGMI